MAGLFGDQCHHYLMVSIAGSSPSQQNALVATREKKATSGQISLMTVALNFFSVHRPFSSGLAATIV
jgi:hypothetical protein